MSSALQKAKTFPQSDAVKLHTELLWLPAAMWNMDALLLPRSMPRVCALRDCMVDMLRNPLLSKVLEAILAGEIDVKALSHNGAVHEHGRLWDLGNWKYAFMFCSLVRLSRRGFDHENRLLQDLTSLSPALAVNAPYTANMLCRKGDIIECVLSESLLTRSLQASHDWQRSCRLFDEAVDDVCRCCFRWQWPPRGHEMPNVSDYSSLVLLAHSMHAKPWAVPQSWYHEFRRLAEHAVLPLERLTSHPESPRLYGCGPTVCLKQG